MYYVFVEVALALQLMGAGYQCSGPYEHETVYKTRTTVEYGYWCLVDGGWKGKGGGGGGNQGKGNK